MTLAGVVLAAGASTRMGRPKALLPLDESTYVESVCRSLSAGGADPLIVVLGADADPIRGAVDGLDAEVVLNLDWEQGMLSSLQAAIRVLERSADAEALLMALVDLPRIRAATVAALIDGWRRSRAPVVVPRCRGKKGHPVVIGRALWSELLSADPSGGARPVLARYAEQSAAVDVDDPWILQDADTPAEHRRMQKGVRRP
jgi:CTP:molybdopterin cytidylyltransferase MocA